MTYIEGLSRFKCTFGIRAMTNKRNVAEVRLNKFCPLRQEGVTVRFETFNRQSLVCWGIEVAMPHFVQQGKPCRGVLLPQTKPLAIGDSPNELGVGVRLGSGLHQLVLVGLLDDPVGILEVRRFLEGHRFREAIGVLERPPKHLNAALSLLEGNNRQGRRCHDCRARYLVFTQRNLYRNGSWSNKRFWFNDSLELEVRNILYKVGHKILVGSVHSPMAYIV